MKHLKTVLVALIILAAAFALVACESDASGTKTDGESNAVVGDGENQGSEIETPSGGSENKKPETSSGGSENKKPETSSGSDVETDNGGNEEATEDIDVL